MLALPNLIDPLLLLYKFSRNCTTTAFYLATTLSLIKLFMQNTFPKNPRNLTATLSDTVVHAYSNLTTMFHGKLELVGPKFPVRSSYTVAVKVL